MSGEIKKKKKTVGLVCNAEIGPAELESSRRSPRRRRLPTPTAAALSFVWGTATRGRSPHRTLGEASRRRLLLTDDIYVDIMSVSSSWQASSIAGITSGLHSPCPPSPHNLRIPKRFFFLLVHTKELVLHYSSRLVCFAPGLYCCEVKCFPHASSFKTERDIIPRGGSLTSTGHVAMNTSASFMSVASQAEVIRARLYSSVWPLGEYYVGWFLFYHLAPV